MTEFDIEEARKAGHSDKDIALFLAKQNPDFDMGAAVKSGHSFANIAQFLSTGKELRDRGPAGAFVEGISAGTADLISTLGGLPVDAANQAIGLIGDKDIPEGTEFFKPVRDFFGSFPQDKPFGGSESIRGGLESAGLAPSEGLETLPKESRPFRVAGEIFGPGVTTGFGLAGAAGNIAKAPTLLKPVIDFARNAPARFLAVETATTSGASLGGGLAEVFDPGDPITRFMSELAGGFFHPAGLISRASGKGASAVKRLTFNFTRAGREATAAKILQDIVEETGENANDIVRLLNQADIGARTTSGVKTGSPALLAMEKKLAQRSAKFAGESENLADNSLKTLRELADNFSKSGDPQALRTAAKMRKTYFDDLLDRRLQEAGQEALEARAQIGTGTRADIPNISTAARKPISDALDEALDVQTSLWAKEPKELKIGIQGLLAATDKVRQKLLPSENLPRLIQDEIARMADKGTNVGEALRFRNRLFALSRKAGAQGDFDLKNTLDTLSAGILDDLDRLPGDVAVEARAFSRSLHDKFTRTFAGQALSRTSTKADRIPPEMLLERAFGSGGTQGDLRFRQLQEAAEFPSGLFGPPMLDSQEQFLRIAAQNSIDDAGRVNPAKLQAFLSKNEAMLNRFPELKTTLKDAVSAEQAFRGVEQASQKATKAINQRAAFANLIKTDDPVVAVGKVLSGANTGRGFGQLAKLARKSGPGATAGLRSSTLKNAYDSAVDSTGRFSFKRYNQILKRGLSKEDQGILPLMLRNRVVDPKTAGRLQKVVNRAIEIEESLADATKLDKLIDNPDGLFDLVTRIVGARIGSQGAVGAGAGTSLIAAGGGSRFAKNFAQKIPATKTSEILEEAALNPKFMATLLKRARTPKQKAELERQLNGFLLAAGLQVADDREEVGRRASGLLESTVETPPTATRPF